MLKSNAKYVQECLKWSNFSTGDEVGKCFSELQEEQFGLVLFPPIIFLLFSSLSLLC